MLKFQTVAALMFALCVSGAAIAGESSADHEARLSAGREAAYRKYLLQPTYRERALQEDVYVGGSSSTGASGATFSASGTISTPSWSLSARGSSQGLQYVSIGSQAFWPRVSPARFNYNFNYRIRPSEPSEAALIFHPNYDSRYRRSWPRPIQIRTWVPSHWTFDGQKYQYVRGYTAYETRWVTIGRERWHFNGGHYSVVKSF